MMFGEALERWRTFMQRICAHICAWYEIMHRLYDHMGSLPLHLSNHVHYEEQPASYSRYRSTTITFEAVSTIGGMDCLREAMQVTITEPRHCSLG
jgi:hypothetical protein